MLVMKGGVGVNPQNESETDRETRGCTSGGAYVPCIYTHAR